MFRRVSSFVMFSMLTNIIALSRFGRKKLPEIEEAVNNLKFE